MNSNASFKWISFADHYTNILSFIPFYEIGNILEILGLPQQKCEIIARTIYKQRLRCHIEKGGPVYTIEKRYWRVCGPACTDDNGTEVWQIKNMLHNAHGPTYKFRDGSQLYWVNDKNSTKKTYTADASIPGNKPVYWAFENCTIFDPNGMPNNNLLRTFEELLAHRAYEIWFEECKNAVQWEPTNNPPIHREDGPAIADPVYANRNRIQRNATSDARDDEMMDALLSRISVDSLVHRDRSPRRRYNTAHSSSIRIRSSSPMRSESPSSSLYDAATEMDRNRIRRTAISRTATRDDALDDKMMADLLSRM